MAARERFAFKRLEVYRVALDYYGWALGVSKRLAESDLPLADQIRRQGQSIVHNTAEGAGLWKSGNKRKHYAVARGSTFEAAAALDLLLIGKHIGPGEFDEREEQLAEAGARLTRLCQRYDSTGKKRT